MSRLNKDGIGSAYRTAKAAAATAVFSGISANDFRKGLGRYAIQYAATTGLGDSFLLL